MIAAAFDDRLMGAPVVTGGGGMGAYRFAGPRRSETLDIMEKKYPELVFPQPASVPGTAREAAVRPALVPGARRAAPVHRPRRRHRCDLVAGSGPAVDPRCPACVRALRCEGSSGCELRSTWSRVHGRRLDRDAGFFRQASAREANRPHVRPIPHRAGTRCGGRCGGSRPSVDTARHTVIAEFPPLWTSPARRLLP